MTRMTRERITESGRRLVEKHWDYVASILRLHGASEHDILIAKQHYLTAGVHFYKHGWLAGRGYH